MTISRLSDARIAKRHPDRPSRRRSLPAIIALALLIIGASFFALYGLLDGAEVPRPAVSCLYSSDTRCTVEAPAGASTVSATPPANGGAFPAGFRGAPPSPPPGRSSPWGR